MSENVLVVWSVPTHKAQHNSPKDIKMKLAVAFNKKAQCFVLGFNKYELFDAFFHDFILIH